MSEDLKSNAEYEKPEDDNLSIAAEVRLPYFLRRGYFAGLPNIRYYQILSGYRLVSRLVYPFWRFSFRKIQSFQLFNARYSPMRQLTITLMLRNVPKNLTAKFG